MPSTVEPKAKPRFRFPSAFTILFALIIFVAALTWVIPAGQYERVASEALGKDVPIAGTYAPTEAAPQGFFDIILAPIAGFYDPVEYVARAIDVSLFVLIIGGFIGVVTASGAIDAGIARAMVRLKGRENWMIPILMALFALVGLGLCYYLFFVEAEGPFHDSLVPELIGISIEGFMLFGLLTLIQRSREAARRKELWLSLRGSFRGLLSNLDVAFLEPDADPASSQQLEADPQAIEHLLARLETRHPDLDCLVALKREAGETLSLTRDLVAVAAQISAAHMNWWVAIVDAIRKLSESRSREQAELALHDLLVNVREFDRLEI